MRSPGRPSAARREDRRQFWVLIAAGRSSEDAAVGVGVAPALGTRWFREAGGMPPSHLSRSSNLLSERHLSFAEREEISAKLKDAGFLYVTLDLVGYTPGSLNAALKRPGKKKSLPVIG